MYYSNEITLWGRFLPAEYQGKEASASREVRHPPPPPPLKKEKEKEKQQQKNNNNINNNKTMASACKTAIPKKVLPLDGLLQMMQQELVKLGNVKCRKNASAHGKIKCARKFRYMFARVKVSKKPDIFLQWPHHTMILENYKKKSFSFRKMFRAWLLLILQIL